ncbi:ribonuclease-like protein p/mrp subunit [Astrocystis sublimbata]|nr:ribonuclease-like protein p/mrp subunit [Astrocystis sublimbata]
MGRSSSFFQSLRKIRYRPNSNGGTSIKQNDMDKSTGLEELYRGENPAIDIIAVHGINGHPVNTFSAQGASRTWLGDPEMLPQDIKDSRILTYGYPASVATVLGSPSSDRILQHAQTMIAELVADREYEESKCKNALKRPIIFVCHSLGGIIVKRALVYSASRKGHRISHLRSIYVSTHGILFFGTPHQGSGVASLATAAQRIIQAVVPSRLVDTQPQLLDALRQGSEILQEVTDNFVPLMKDLSIFFFWEQEKTDLRYKYDYVVTESSAAPILDNTERSGLRADHRSMCTFASRNAPGYRLVAPCLIRYSRNAPQAIDRKWRVEEENRGALRQQEMRDLVEDSERQKSRVASEVELKSERGI